MFEVLDVEFDNLVNGDPKGEGEASMMSLNGVNGTGPTMRQTAMSNGTSMNILNAAGNDPSKQGQGTVNIFKYLEGRDSGEEREVDELQEGKKAAVGGNFGDDGDESEDIFDNLGAEEVQEDIMETGLIIHKDNPHGLDDLTVLP